jgi:hypothetical protein
VIQRKRILIAVEIEYDDETMDVTRTDMGSSTSTRGTLADVAEYVDGKFARDRRPMLPGEDDYNLYGTTIFPPDAATQQALALLEKGP